MDDKKISPTGKTGNAPSECRTTSRKRILVVHDDADMRQLSTSILVRSGYKVDAAADNAAAWQALNSVSYDLLITDYEMPKVSGVELLKKLHAVRRALPVIVASPDLPKKEFTRNPWLQPAVTLLMPYTAAEFLGTVKEVLYATTSSSEPSPSKPKSRPSSEGWQL